MPPLLALYAKQFLEIKLFTFDYHENKSQRTIDKVCFIRPKVHFAPEFSFNDTNSPLKMSCNWW